MTKQPPEMASDAELDAVLKLHRKSPVGLECMYDGEFWQCPTRRMVHELRYRRGGHDQAEEGQE